MKNLIVYLEKLIINPKIIKIMEKFIALIKKEIAAFENGKLLQVIKIIIDNLTALLDYVAGKATSFILITTGNANIDKAIQLFADIAEYSFPGLPAAVQSIIDQLSTWSIEIEESINKIPQTEAQPAPKIAPPLNLNISPSFIALLQELKNIAITANNIVGIPSASMNATAIQKMVANANALIAKIPGEIK